jgi:hypothetical protein
MEETVHTVIVEPVEAGWTVNVGNVENPMIFSSGRAAERAGRDLAMRLAESGKEVRLELRLRGGAVAARFICFPPLEHEDGPLMVTTPPTRGRVADALA